MNELGMRHPERSEGTVECGSAGYCRLFAFQGRSEAAALHQPPHRPAPAGENAVAGRPLP